MNSFPLTHVKTLFATFFFTVTFMVLTAFAANENGDSPFQGNRRPGILAEPSDVPTGENTKLYERMGHPGPKELLDLLSEDPKVSNLSTGTVLNEEPLSEDEAKDSSSASDVD